MARSKFRRARGFEALEHRQLLSATTPRAVPGELVLDGNAAVERHDQSLISRFEFRIEEAARGNFRLVVLVSDTELANAPNASGDLEIILGTDGAEPHEAGDLNSLRFALDEDLAVERPHDAGIAESRATFNFNPAPIFVDPSRFIDAVEPARPAPDRVKEDDDFGALKMPPLPPGPAPSAPQAPPPTTTDSPGPANLLPNLCDIAIEHFVIEVRRGDQWIDVDVAFVDDEPVALDDGELPPEFAHALGESSQDAPQLILVALSVGSGALLLEGATEGHARTSLSLHGLGRPAVSSIWRFNPSRYLYNFREFIGWRKETSRPIRRLVRDETMPTEIRVDNATTADRLTTCNALWSRVDESIKAIRVECLQSCRELSQLFCPITWILRCTVPDILRYCFRGKTDKARALKDRIARENVGPIHRIVAWYSACLAASTRVTGRLWTPVHRAIANEPCKSDAPNLRRQGGPMSGIGVELNEPRRAEPPEEVLNPSNSAQIDSMIDDLPRFIAGHHSGLEFVASTLATTDFLTTKSLYSPSDAAISSASFTPDACPSVGGFLPEVDIIIKAEEAESSDRPPNRPSE